MRMTSPDHPSSDDEVSISTEQDHAEARLDWLRSLDGPCPACGLDPEGVSVEEVADRTEVAAVEWFQILTQASGVVTRPEPQIWSPLEYGSHVRDVFELCDARVAFMLTQDTPDFEDWDQNEAAETGGYAGGDPETVADQLTTAATGLVARLRSLSPEQRQRRARRADGAEFTVEQVTRMLLHEVVHHLWDVTGQTDAAGSL